MKIEHTKHVLDAILLQDARRNKYLEKNPYRHTLKKS